MLSAAILLWHNATDAWLYTFGDGEHSGALDGILWVVLILATISVMNLFVKGVINLIRKYRKRR
jgi:hypothetical protein